MSKDCGMGFQGLNEYEFSQADLGPGLFPVPV